LVELLRERANRKRRRRTSEKRNELASLHVPSGKA
jgi:hypothetical protein